ncbi:hypothetical protein ES705_07693 [subsurface metagenome]
MKKVIVYIVSILAFLVIAKFIPEILYAIGGKSEIFAIIIFIAFIAFYFICKKRGIFKDTFKKK